MTICCSCFIGPSFCAIVYTITPQKSYLITEHIQQAPFEWKNGIVEGWNDGTMEQWSNGMME
jgi:hypothetical protein